MTIPLEVIAELATLGLSKEQAQSVADMLGRVEAATNAAGEASKEKARVRWRKWDEKRRSTNGGKRLQASDRDSKQLAGAEDRTSTTVIEPQDKKQNATPRDEDAFRGGLMPDVPFDLVTEFIKVRRKKRGAITGYAAKLFREDAAACSMSVADAAKECVRSSWITVKPEYFTGRQRAGPAPPKPNPGLAAADALMERYDAVSPSQTEANPPYLSLVALPGR